MNELEIILLAVGGGTLVIVIISFIAYCFATKNRRTYEPLEKGNVFVYQKDNSQQIKEDTIMMNARFYLRSTIYSLQSHCSQIGSRTDKNYFSVYGTSLNKSENDRLMSMVPVSNQWPIPLHTEAGRTTYKSIIKSLEIHPFISVPLIIDYIPDKSCSVSVRPFYSRGSLKDYIHQSKPKTRYQDKYQANFQLNEKLISKFGRQILEALIFMKYHNFPYFHLNSSNVLLDDNVCLISDYENAFLGLRPKLSKILTSYGDKLDPDVLSFACILFEMGCGYELESKESIDVGIPAHCHPEVKKILESIFKPWYGNPPTLEELVKLDFFSYHKFKNLPIARITYTSRERDMIDAVIKLNKTFLNTPPSNNPNQKIDTNVGLKELKKQKKRKQLTFLPVEVNLSSTNLSSSLPNSFSTGTTNVHNIAPSNSNSNYNHMASTYSSSSSLSTTTPPQLSKTTSSSNLNYSSTPNPPPPSPASNSIGSVTPPPPPPPPPPKGAPPPPPPPSIPPPPASSNSRKNLLSSIESFSSSSLKKTKTKDKSAPKLK